MKQEQHALNDNAGAPVKTAILQNNSELIGVLKTGNLAVISRFLRKDLPLLSALKTEEPEGRIALMLAEVQGACFDAVALRGFRSMLALLEDQGVLEETKTKALSRLYHVIDLALSAVKDTEGTIAKEILEAAEPDWLATMTLPLLSLSLGKEQTEALFVEAAKDTRYLLFVRNGVRYYPLSSNALFLISKHQIEAGPCDEDFAQFLKCLAKQHKENLTKETVHMLFDYIEKTKGYNSFEVFFKSYRLLQTETLPWLQQVKTHFSSLFSENTRYPLTHAFSRLLCHGMEQEVGTEDRMPSFLSEALRHFDDEVHMACLLSAGKETSPHFEKRVEAIAKTLRDPADFLMRFQEELLAAENGKAVGMRVIACHEKSLRKEEKSYFQERFTGRHPDNSWVVRFVEQAEAKAFSDFLKETIPNAHPIPIRNGNRYGVAFDRQEKTPVFNALTSNDADGFHAYRLKQAPAESTVHNL